MVKVYFRGHDGSSVIETFYNQTIVPAAGTKIYYKNVWYMVKGIKHEIKEGNLIPHVFSFEVSKFGHTQENVLL